MFSDWSKERKQKWGYALIFVGIIFVLLISRRPPPLVSLDGKTMGTTYHVKYVDNGHGIKPEAVSNDIEVLLKEVNRQMSTYLKDSEISQFNQKQDKEWFKISDDFFHVLQFSLNVAKKTKGVFDPTIGPLVNLWGFGPSGERKVPSKEKIAAAREKVGFQKIQLDPSKKSIQKQVEGLYLDLSASAKGFAVDAISQFLRRQGIENHMIEIGGEVRTAGTKYGNPWNIAIESPSTDSKMVQKVLKLKNQSLATSGSYRNFFESQGKKYSHALDYQTGSPVDHKLISVSVLSPRNCMEADAWATALMVLGPVKGLQLAKELGIAAYFIYEEGQVKEAMTESFMKVLSGKGI